MKLLLCLIVACLLSSTAQAQKTYYYEVSTNGYGATAVEAMSNPWIQAYFTMMLQMAHGELDNDPNMSGPTFIADDSYEELPWGSGEWHLGIIVSVTDWRANAPDEAPPIAGLTPLDGEWVPINLKTDEAMEKIWKAFFKPKK